MRFHRFVLALALVAPAAGMVGCKEAKPLQVEPGDAVRCCFLVPYDGLAGPEQVEECMPHSVCAGPDHDDTEDVCMPLACESGDATPYGRTGPSGTTVVTGSCTFDVPRTTVERGGCSGEATRPHG
jgi:hypothetical protein